jgi:hypothetical protein
VYMRRRPFFVCILAVAMLTIALSACERRSAKISECVFNLQQIRYCKQQWAGNEEKTTNDVPTWDDLKPFFLPRWSNNIPVCPSGGTYVIGRVGEDPTCPVGGKGHAILHALDEAKPRAVQNN